MFRPALLALALATGFASGSGHGQALPVGGVAILGQASISTPAPNQLRVVTQNGLGTNHSAINWQSFSIAAGSSTTFVQPSASSLSINRVVTNTPSAIFGALSSNGRLVLVNQSGIAVGAGAVIDTAGFTASALRMSDADALAGRLRFGDGSVQSSMGGASGITVGGRITARDGDVVLVAPNIEVGSTALLRAPNGSTVLAAGQQVEITGRGLEGITLLVQAPTDQARNLGRLEGNAVGIFAGTLRHSGEIQATTASLEGGTVVLRASGDAYVEGAGTITATGTKGGNVDVLGHRVAVMGHAAIDVSGANGGGSIRVGGDYQGRNPDVPNAAMSYLGPDATLKADAIDSGNGGRVIVWADEQTKAFGTISARGGAHAGDGGFVEVSGKHGLAFDARVNTLAPLGKTGTLLLDPNNIDVQATGGAVLGDVDQFLDFGSASLVIAASTINAAASNVELQANQNITISAPIAMTNPGVGLTARAGFYVTVGPGATITTKGGAVSLLAGDLGSLTSPSQSAVLLRAAIDTTNGGTFPAGANVTIKSRLQDLGTTSVELNANINAGTAGTVVLDSFASAVQGGRVDQISGVITARNLAARALEEIILGQNNAITGDVNLSSNLGAGSGGTITFKNVAPSFNLSGATAKGTITITGTGASPMTTTGPVQSTGGNVSITSAGGIALDDDVLSAGTLTLASTNADIRQTFLRPPLIGKVVAAGPTTISAGTGDISLTHSGNDFSSITVSGGNIAVSDDNALVVTGFTRNLANANLSFFANGGALTLPAGDINVGSGAIQLHSAAAFTTPGNLTANFFLELGSSAGLTLAHNLSTTGTLQLQAGGAGINQTAGTISAAGATTVSATGANVSMALPGNNFSSLSVTGGAIDIVQGAGNLLTLTALTNSAGQPVSISADDLNITGAVSAVGNTVTLRPTSLARNILIESSPTAGVMSLSPGELQLVTAATLDIGRLDGTGNLDVKTFLGNGNINVGTLRLLAGNNLNSIAGADIGNGGTPFNHDLQLRANNDVQLSGSAFLAANRSLTVVADNDISGAGNVAIGSIAIQILGGAGNTTGNMSFAGRDITATASGNVLGFLQVGGTGTQSFTAANDILFANNNTASGFLVARTDGGDQTITAGNRLMLSAGTGAGTHTAFESGGKQTVGATLIDLAGGLSGGGITGAGNYVTLASNGIQEITVGNGGLTLKGGGGTGADTGNSANVEQNGGVGTSQKITINGTGFIKATAGSSARTGVGDQNGSRASIRSDNGDSQTVEFMGSGLGRTIDLTGGTVGSDAYAEIYAGRGTQDVTGARLITLKGGDSGGGVTDGLGNTHGNLAAINAEQNTQTIGADGILLQGGIGGTNNLAAIVAKANQQITVGNGGLTLTGGGGGASELKNAAIVFKGNDVAGTSQKIYVGGGGAITLRGGSASGTTVGYDANLKGLSNGSFVAIRSDGATQLIEFSAPGGSIDMKAGTVGSNNLAFIQATAGSQTIRGDNAANAPSIILKGGDSGGVTNEGNRTLIGAETGTQVVTASSIDIRGGLTGTENLAQIRQGSTTTGLAATQTVTVLGNGNIALRGGGGDTNLARIQSYGLTQTVDLGASGSLDLTGGTGTGFNFARIEALNGDQSVTGSGAITITGGPSGGAVGTGNFADIRQRAAAKLQSVSASALTIEAGAGGVDNNAGMRADGNQTVALETAGSNALKIGAATSAGVSYITGNNQIVTAGNGAQSGSITVRGGTVAGQNAGIFNNSGTQTIATTGVLQMTGGTAVGSASSCGAATGGSCADINNDGTGLQKVSAGTINLQGGNAGVGNGAGIFVSAGNMEINAGTGGLHLTGGTGTSDNFASIGGGNSSGRTLKINVIGDTTLDAANGTTGSGSFIGLGSTGNLGSTTIDFNGTGNLTLTGSTVSSTLAGAAIGAGSNQTNTTATIDIDAADITFVPNISGVRIGHGVSANGPGVITINATGSVALNSSGTVGSAIRTTGNVFIHADGAGKTITEGASSVIGADTLTVSANAGVALPGANRVATLNASSLAGNIDFSNTQSLSVGSASTGAGAQAVGISAIGGSSSLTLGATTSDDNWTLISGGATVLGGAFSANDISITSGAALALSQNLVVARTLDLITPNGNNIVQTGGAITAAGQTTVNAVGGTVFLAGAGNNFNQIGVTGGAVTLTDVNAVTLGNSTVQDLFLSAGGSITMGGSVTATGPGTAIELVVGSGAGNGFVNPIGSGALNATGGGRWLVYSNDPALDTRGGLVYGFKQYGAVFGDTVLGTTGNGFIMGLTPTVTASLTGPVSKPYDRLDTATLTGANYLVSGLPGDVLTLNNPVAGTYDTRNAGGPNKIVTVTGVTVASAMDGTATVFGYPNVGTLSGPVGTIVAATITAVNGITASKEYDGTASATALTTGATFTGKLPGDILTVASGSGNFTGPNAIDVGSGKPLAVSGIVLGGTDVGNYTLAAAATTATGAGTITARAVSNWTGTTPGALWSDSANWDVVPTAGNVLSVAIPAGAGSVVFDPAAGTTSLLNLSSQRPVSVTGGTLQIGTSLSTPSYDQSGGAVTGAGSMNVTGSFVQTGGSVALGSITITHASGNLVFANLSAPSVSLAAPTGAISQTGPLVAGSLVTASMSGTNLTTAGNQIGTWVAQNQGSGAISLVNTGALVLAGLNNNAGNIDVTNTGAITTVAAIVASAGSVRITANSPLYVGAGGVTASGDVTLIAGNISSGNLTLDGPVVAGNKVVLDAANTLAQNSSVLGPNGVTADAGVSMAAYGPLATSKGSSVVYRAGGVSVAPPPTELLATAVQPDVLVTFLELFEAAVAEQQGGSIATNADGSRKRKAADALVTEGEICRP